MSARRILTLVTSVVLLQACGGGDSSTPSEPEPEPSPTANSMSVSPSSASSNAHGDTTDFSATVRDQDGNTMSGVSVSWSSTNQGVASVANDGRAVSQGDGTADIVASAEGLADSATITVDQEAAQLSVSPAADTLTAGDSAQLSANATDANGHTVGSPSFTWSSSDTSVATVDSTGFVRTKTDGSTDVTAKLDGVTDTSAVAVAPPAGGAPSVSSVSPSPLPEGGSATVSGLNFSSDPAANTVVVDGDTAQVVSATSTSLDINVPLYDCLPARSVLVKVTTSAGADSVAASLSPNETPVQLALGEQRRVGDPSNFCLQFESSGSSERYLIGVQSLSNTASSLTPVQITAEAADGSGATLEGSITDAGRLKTSGSSGSEALDIPQRWKDHREAEVRLRREERELLNSGSVSPATTSPSGPVTTRISVDSTTSLGDTVSLRVPDISSSGSSCDNYNQIGAVVKAIGSRAILVADTANPENGFTDTDYQNLSDRIDNDIFSTQVTYFGSPTDSDNNGHIVAVFTKELNRTAPNTLGFVSGTNMLSRSSCPSSDEGEYFYGKVPDPNGVYGPAYSTSKARLDAPFIMAHELTHVIQQTRRYFSGKPIMSSEVSEAQATLSEEVVGHSVTGRQSGQNYGYSVATNSDGSDEIDWYRNAFVDLRRYFGFESTTSQVNGAPEECGWWQDSSSPCIARSLWYGVGWSFLRWVTDQYGASHPGGKTGFHQDLVDGNQAGLGMIETLTGASLESLMAEWAASFYVDDRLASPDKALETQSWNYFDIYENHGYESGTLNPFEAGFTDWGAVGDIRASSAGYIAVDGNGRPATALKIRDSTGATLPSYMQIWVVRLQ